MSVSMSAARFTPRQRVVLLVLPAAGFTLVCGRLADTVGRRRMFLTGLVLLVAASLLGGLATTATSLLTARALQGSPPR